MEKKETFFGNFFRPFLSIRNVYRPLFRPSARSTGFTLVEILIVIAMAALLTTVALMFINPVEQLKRSRDSARKADVKVIQSALELYRADSGSYPTASANSIDNCSGTFVDECGANQTTVYLQKVPKDPNSTLNSGNYYYSCTNSCAGYELYACLESANDKDGVTTGKPTAFNACTKVLKVTNP